MEIIGSATLASAVFNSSVTGGYYANKSGCFGKLCRIVKKLAMEKTHCIVVPDGFNHYIHEQLFSTSESLKILDLERTFNLLFNKDTLSVLKRLKVEFSFVYDLKLSTPILLASPESCFKIQVEYKSCLIAINVTPPSIFRLFW